MVAIPDDQYVARCTFQQDLDEAFPQGAMCAILPIDNDRPRPAEWAEGTGRILCSDAQRMDAADSWRYEILIDTRTRIDRPRHEVRVWISELSRNPRIGSLWEAQIDDDGDDGERMLRLNADPPDVMKPTPAMRSAVTRLHQSDLFPEGLEL